MRRIHHEGTIVTISHPSGLQISGLEGLLLFLPSSEHTQRGERSQRQHPSANPPFPNRWYGTGTTMVSKVDSEPNSTLPPSQTEASKFTSTRRKPPTLEDRDKESFWHGIYYTVMILLNTMMYLTVICLAIYTAAVYYAPSMLVRTILLLYIPYVLLDRTHVHGITSWRWVSYETIEQVRSWPTLWAATAYFPAIVHKTHDLDPSKPYILTYHPHGVISMGLNCALNTNGAGFPELFPGLRRWGVTLREVFYFLLVREFVLALGFISCERSTLENKLREGDSIVLCTGGAEEALYAQKGRFTLYLKRRKGFIRLALETGAAVVPCLGFGENDAFATLDVANDSALMKTLLQIRKFLRFSTPIMTWPIPRRTPIHVVVGAPVQFAPGTSVDQCHTQYIQAVSQLYEAHKSKYGHEKIPLEII